MNYRWVFFDADGTLFDFDAAQAAALDRTWRSLDLDPVVDLLERYQRINLDLWRRYEQGLVSQDHVRMERFAALLENVGESPHRTEDVAQEFTANLSTEGQLFEGAKDLLGDLGSRFSMALVTNGLAEVQRGRIACSGIGHYFNTVIISSEVGAAKPAAEFFDAAFAASGDPDRDEVIIVGDSLSSDIQGGHDYGIATCWFNPDGNEADGEWPVPDHTVGDYGALRRVLGTVDGG